MPTQSKNVFIVQTAQSNQNGRPQSSQISLINKQSALYKYRQQKKQKEDRAFPERARPSPNRGLDAHRNSWLLESRVTTLPPRTPGDPINDRDDPSAGKDQQLDAWQVGKLCSKEPQYSIDEAVQLHDCYAGLRTDPLCCMPLENSSVVLSVSDLCQSSPHI